jgi:hypothetical protein
VTLKVAAQAPLTPSDPITAVLNAFRTHRIVALPDAHRNTAIHTFLLSLVRDPRFPTTVDDVVVEFGNARYQDLVDRFVSGEHVPHESLRRVWLDTTQAQPASDTPHAEEVIRAVRAVNASVSRNRRVRVLLGDPPIDWETVKTKADHWKWIAMRETYPADLIGREVLEKGRRALVVYGVGHLQRKNPQANFESAGPAASLISLLEESGTKTFNVSLAFDLSTEHVDAAAWPVPSLVALRGTTMGATPVRYDGPRVAVQGGQFVPVPRDAWRSMRMEDQFDALLYIGPRTAWRDAMVSPALCADPSYVEMRRRRMALVEWKADRLEDYCGNVRPRQE